MIECIVLNIVILKLFVVDLVWYGKFVIKIVLIVFKFYCVIIN